MLYSSAYLKMYPWAGGLIAWHGGDMRFFYLPGPYGEVLEKYRSGRNAQGGEAEERLAAWGLLTGNDEAGQRNELKEHHQTVPSGWNDLQVMLTDACNLNCVYCQIEQNKDAGMNRDLSDGRLAGGIALFLQQGDLQGSTINFTGGEALLRFPLIQSAVTQIERHCRQQSLTRPRLVVNTNGVLIGDEHAAFFREHDILVIVSLDGPEKSHDQMRRDFAGRGTYTSVIRAVNRLVRAGVRTGLAGVAGTHNRGQFESLVHLAGELGVGSLGINPPHYIKPAGIDWMQNMVDYTRELMAVFPLANRMGLFLEQPYRRIGPLLSRTPRLRDCRSCSSRAALMPDGHFAPCYTYPYGSGEAGPDSAHGFVFAKSSLAAWHRRSTLSIDHCSTCPWVLVCGAGCTTDAFASGGNLLAVDERYCLFTGTIMDWVQEKLRSQVQNPHQAVELDPDRIENIRLAAAIKHDLQRSVGH